MGQLKATRFLPKEKIWLPHVGSKGFRTTKKLKYHKGPFITPFPY
jgi:hypothetical protein